MKTEMNEDGVITIRPESSVEAYALRQWMDHQKIQDSDGPTALCSLDTSKLLINAEWPPKIPFKHESPRGILDYLGEKP